MPNVELWRRARVMQALGVGRTKLIEMVRACEISPPIVVSGTVRAWPSNEITDFINHRIAASRGSNPTENSHGTH